MSSLFSYELNEEQIRSTLLKGSGKAEFTDAAWDEFEANYVQNITTTNPVKFKLPEFNLNINRNIVLPVLFIAALVGVSAIMLSFVDFKTNAPAQVEKGLVPAPGNYKPEESKAAILIKKEPEKKVEKPMVKQDSVVHKPVIPVTNTATQVIIARTTPPVNTSNNNNSIPVTKTESQVTKTEPVIQNNNTANIRVTDTTNVTQTTDRGIIPSNNLNFQNSGRKKRRKLPPEQIETIKAPSILGVETTKKEEEPELEIKVD